jgi:hypothetical protein
MARDGAANRVAVPLTTVDTAFASVCNDALMSVYVKAANGSGSGQVLYKGSDPGWGSASPSGWSPDGRSLFVDFANSNRSNILQFARSRSTFARRRKRGARGRFRATTVEPPRQAMKPAHAPSRE